MKTNKLTLLASSALLAFSANASAVTIDLFTDNQAKLEDSTAENNNSFMDGSAVFSSVNGSLTSILGGNRDLGVNLVTDPLSNGAFTQVAGGYWSFNSGSGAVAQGIVQWDGSANTDLTINPTGLGGVDLTEGGTLTNFGVKTIFSDLNFLFTIKIWDTTLKSVAVTLASHDVPLTLPDGIFSLIGFDTFQNCGPVNIGEGVMDVQCSTPGVGVDLTKVGAIELVLNPLAGTGAGTGYVALDLTLNSIQTVPEPSVIGLLGIGLAGIGAVSGRRKQIKA